jgi:glycylpeptide N-tetradecanoyltransferase
MSLSELPPQFFIRSAAFYDLHAISTLRQVCKNWKNHLDEPFCHLVVKKISPHLAEGHTPADSSLTWRNVVDRILASRKNLFWKPVEKSVELPEGDGATDMPIIEQPVRETSYNLPKGFSWLKFDVNIPAHLDELYEFLDANNTEDPDHVFREHHTKDFLKWTLVGSDDAKDTFAGFEPVYVAVEVETTHKLVGFIAAVPMVMRVYNKVVPIYHAKLLGVHQKLRGKKLAKVIVKELVRRLSLNSKLVQQGLFVLGVNKPDFFRVCESKMYGLIFDFPKMAEIGFCNPRGSPPVAKPEQIVKVTGLRPLTEADLPQCYDFVTNYLARFAVAPALSFGEFRHHFATREKLLSTYVVEDPATKQISDLFSFYSTPKRVLMHPRFKTINSVFIQYFIALKTPVTALLESLLTIAKRQEEDLVVFVDIMEHAKLTESNLCMGLEPGLFEYYMHNWLCPEIKSDQWAFVDF